MVKKIIAGTYNLAADPTWAELQNQDIYLECDSALGAIIINLPAISALKQWNARIFVNDATGNAAIHAITVVADVTAPDKINNAANLVIATAKGSAQMSPVGATSWQASALTGGKSYVALLTQAAGAAPVATILKNTLGGVITWARTGAGIYTGTIAPAGGFVASKTSVIIAQTQGIANQISAAWTDANTITVDTGAAGVAADSILSATAIEIVVYP